MSIDSFRIVRRSRQIKMDSERQSYVAFSVDPPTLQEYKSLSFERGIRKTRIQHCNTVQDRSISLQKIQENPQKWESELTRYMGAKERFNEGHDLAGNKFAFLKLSKINIIRKQKMLYRNGLLAMSIDQNEESQQIPHNRTQRTENNRVSMAQKMLCPKGSKSQNEKILKSFLSRYFKKKLKNRFEMCAPSDIAKLQDYEQ